MRLLFVFYVLADVLVRFGQSKSHLEFGVHSASSIILLLSPRNSSFSPEIQLLNDQMVISLEIYLEQYSVILRYDSYKLYLIQFSYISTWYFYKYITIYSFKYIQDKHLIII